MKKYIVWALVFIMFAFNLLACGVSSVGVPASVSSSKAITAFSFTSPAATGTINESAKTIAVTVPYGTNVTALAGTFTTTGASVSVGSTVQVSGTTPNDFTNPVIYTATASNGSTTSYTVTVTVASNSSQTVNSSVITGTNGTMIYGQSFNETRAVNVTVLGIKDRITETITLNGVNTNGATSALIGARVYDTSTKTLIASNNATVGAGNNLSVTIDLITTLTAGKTYTIGFYVQTAPLSQGSGNFYLPNSFLNLNNIIPYVEDSGIFQINSASSIASDSYPEFSNQAVPQIIIATH